MARLRLNTILLSVILTAGCALSSQPMETRPQVENTPVTGAVSQPLRSLITSDMTELSRRCFPHIKGLHSPGIPDDISDSPDLSGAPFEITAIDLGRIFRYTFVDTTITGWTAQASINRRFLPIPEVRPAPTSGEDAYLYTQTCNSLLKGAIEGGFNAKVPVAEFRAAVDGNYSTSSRKELAYIRGRFDSPFGTLLRSSRRSDELAAHFAVWEVYRQNPELQSGKGYYLDHATGWLRSWLFRTGRQLSMKLDADAGANWILANVNASLTAQASSDTELTGSMYRIWVSSLAAPKTYNVHFEPLPDIDAIKRVLLNSSGLLDGPDPNQRLVSPAGVQLHRQVVYGLPAYACTLELWNRRPALKNPQLGRVEIIAMTPESAANRCVFDVRYSYEWANVRPTLSQSGEVFLEYPLDYQRSVVTSGTTHTLTINAQARLAGTEAPRLEPLQGVTPTVRFSTVDYILTFRVPLAVLGEVSVNMTQLGAQGKSAAVQGVVSCGDWSSPMLVWVSKRVDTGHDIEGEARLSSTSTPSTATCEARASIPIPLSSGQQPLRPILVRFSEPQLVPSPTPAVSTAVVGG